MKFSYYKVYSQDETLADWWLGKTEHMNSVRGRLRSQNTNPNSSTFNTAFHRFVRENGGIDKWNIEVIEVCEFETRVEAEKRFFELYDTFKPTLNTHYTLDLRNRPIL